MRSTRFALSAAAILVSACASGGSQTADTRTDRNLLTQAQLASTNAATVFDALEKMRPEWLTTRGPVSMTNAEPSMVNVFMNGQLLGKPDVLRDLRITDISQVRYWPAGPAAAKFGMGHPRGVIEITSR